MAKAPVEKSASEAILEGQIEVLSAKLDSKPGPLAVFGLMVAVVALPIGILTVWFPSDIAELKTSIASLSESVEATRKSAQAAEEASKNVADRFEGLVLAMARSTAQSDSVAKFAVMKKYIPNGTYKYLLSVGLVPKFAYSDFDNQQWMFIPLESYNKIPGEARDVIEQGFKRGNVKFTVDTRALEGNLVTK